MFRGLEFKILVGIVLLWISTNSSLQLLSIDGWIHKTFKEYEVENNKRVAMMRRIIIMWHNS